MPLERRAEELCRFGAASYLYYGGVFSLTVNLLALASAAARWAALLDGRIRNQNCNIQTIYKGLSHMAHLSSDYGC